jgi:hypothetical protein
MPEVAHVAWYANSLAGKACGFLGVGGYRAHAPLSFAGRLFYCLMMLDT